MERIAQIIFILSFFFCGACVSKEAATSSKAIQDSESPPDLTMEKMKVQSYGIGGIEWEMRAPKAQSYSMENKIVAEDLTVRIFEKGVVSTTLTSDHGVMNSIQPTDEIQKEIVAEGRRLNPGDMYLRGHVVAVSTAGTKVMTDWAQYYRQRQLIVSTAPVQVIREDSVTYGSGMEADADLSNIRIFNQKLVIKGKDE